MPTIFKNMLHAVVLAAAASAALPAAATVLTFDDLSGATNSFGYAPIPNGYGGLNWNNMNYHDNTVGERSGYYYGTVSGKYVAFNLSANPAEALSVSSAQSFDFNSAYLTAAWNKNLNIDIEGRRNGTLVYRRTVVVSDLAPTLFNFDFLGIDNLKFTSYGGTDNPATGGIGAHFVMDNFRFNEPAQVPEPASLSLLGLGLAGFVAARRRSNGKRNG